METKDAPICPKCKRKCETDRVGTATIPMCVCGHIPWENVFSPQVRPVAPDDRKFCDKTRASDPAWQPDFSWMSEDQRRQLDAQAYLYGMGELD